MRLYVSALVLGLTTSLVAGADTFANKPNSPEEIQRLPDSEWDHIIRGSDIRGKATRDTDSKDESDAYVANYDLRSKIVDPSSLGIDTVKQLSGYLDDNVQDKHLFFWFFESRNDPKNDPVVLWLNGGPGCSSMAGLFDELGPAKFPNPDLQPVRNEYSWNNNASVIFIDQPVNTGYSYSGSNVNSSVAAARDLYAMLTLFFTQYPEYASQKFHISGESYAGHYIPLTGSEILSHANRNINLKSLLIGNGLTDPFTQYDYYRPMACGDGGYPAVLSSADCRKMDQALPECKRRIKSCYDSEDTSICRSATSYCNGNVLNVYQRGSDRSVYDVRIRNGEGTPSYSVRFLNSDNTKRAIGVETRRSFSVCNFDVYDSVLSTGDWMKPIHRVIPGILDKVPVGIFAGDADYICNWLGNQAWTEALEWSGKTAFNNAPVRSLSINGRDEYGKVKSSGGFTFMQIYEAGHMVPADQPKPSLDFFNRWIAGEWKS